MDYIELEEISTNNQNLTQGNEENQNKSSTLNATFNMSKTIVGAGVFGIPNIIQKSGFFCVVLLIVLMAFLISWTLTVLLNAGLSARADSYHELMHKCWGIQGFRIYSFFSFAFAFGGMCGM